jgi:hypothetical protein
VIAAGDFNPEVHVSEFSNRASDHDPALARFNLTAPAAVPSAGAGHLVGLVLALSAAALSVLSRRSQRSAA